MNNFYKLSQDAQEEIVNFMKDIIAIPSLSSQEGDVVQRMKKEMEKLGYDEVTVDPMGNLIGRIGNGPKSICFDGHCDVVDVGDPANWKREPFGPTVENGILYGRGTSDQKGGVGCSIYGMALLKQQGWPENLTAHVVASVQEEDCDGLCWQYIIREDKLVPDLVVLTEPTSLRIYRGHRGRMEIEVSTQGVSCHGSAPERGVNAVYKMAPIIADIEKLNEELQPVPPLTKGTVTISHIRSTSPSLCAVADGCTIHLDRRLTIGEDEQVAVSQIENLPSVKAAGAKVKVLTYAVPSYTGLTYPTKKYFPTWEMPQESKPVQTAVAAFKDTFGEDPEVGHWTFSTNGIATAGMHNVPSIGFGPGHEHFAHAPNEEVEVEHLVRATAFYAGMAQAFAEA
ncbi:MAG: YgeY family selenium metabolism-linked hydrolase [Verrucomicrobia bacterium]|nr:YgeY family selenium metabolism-linked hydrolase [Verrucomicrobiota bacterium]